MPVSGPTWIVLTRDVSYALRIDDCPVVVAGLILDADTGLIRGVSVAPSGPAARAQAIQQALTNPAGTLPPGPPARVLCGVGDAGAVTSELAAFLDAPPVASEVLAAEAEDIFDSLVGHLAGRRQPEMFATPDEWAQLVAASAEYRQAEPWLRWADDQPLDLVVGVAEVAARYVAIVLGQEGIQRGLVLYPGALVPAGGVPREQAGTEPSVPAGTLMFYLGLRHESPPEFAAKAERYGWPLDADLAPAWVAGGPAGEPMDLDQTAVHRLILAIAAVLTHDVQPHAADPTTGEVAFPGNITGSFTISTGAPEQPDPKARPSG
ncbi:MAG: hypothetical protein J2P28_13465 [Actinobacteria bacterium]|nr:hypothetical protein [Actinomycetota bacterium]